MMHMMIAGALALGAAQVPQRPTPAPAPAPPAQGTRTAPAAAPRAQQLRLDTTFTVRPGGHIQVENQSGLVTVRSWERNDVRVQASHAGNATVELSHSSNNVTVEAAGPPRNRADINVTLDISVPRSFRVSTEGINTHINIDGIDADVNVETINGNVNIKDVAGRVVVEAVSGAIAVHDVRGNVDAASTNQGIRLSNVVGNIIAETVNGGITILNAESGSVTAETVNGGIILGTTIRDGGRYSAATTNGNIYLGVPAGTNATVDASTFSGRVVSNVAGQMERRRTGSYTVRIGNGGAQVELEAFSGTITLLPPADLAGLKEVKGAAAPRIQ